MSACPVRSAARYFGASHRFGCAYPLRDVGHDSRQRLREGMRESESMRRLTTHHALQPQLQNRSGALTIGEQLGVELQQIQLLWIRNAEASMTHTAGAL